MSKHRFAIGDLVKVIPGADTRNRARSLADSQFKVIRLMPMGISAFQYRVQDMFSGQERVVSEYEVSAYEAAGDKDHDR